MNVAIERYFIPIFHSDNRLFNLNFSIRIDSFHNSHYRVVLDESGEIVKDGFHTLEDAIDYCNYNEHILCQ